MCRGAAGAVPAKDDGRRSLPIVGGRRGKRCLFVVVGRSSGVAFSRFLSARPWRGRRCSRRFVRPRVYGSTAAEVSLYAREGICVHPRAYGKEAAPVLFLCGRERGRGGARRRRGFGESDGSAGFIRQGAERCVPPPACEPSLPHCSASTTAGSSSAGVVRVPNLRTTRPLRSMRNLAKFHCMSPVPVAVFR